MELDGWSVGSADLENGFFGSDEGEVVDHLSQLCTLSTRSSSVAACAVSPTIMSAMLEQLTMYHCRML